MIHVITMEPILDQRKNDTDFVTAVVSDLFRKEMRRKRVTKAALVKRVKATDPRFSAQQFNRITMDGKADWTLDRFVLVAEALGLDPANVLRDALRTRGDPDEGAEGQVTGESARASSSQDDARAVGGRGGRSRRPR